MHKQLYFLLFLGVQAGFLAAAQPRLVSTTPQVTEILFDVGLGPAVVAAPHGWNSPQVARTLDHQKIPSIGDFSSINFEALLKARPTLAVLDSQVEQADLETSLRSFQIPSLTLNFRTPETLARSLETLSLRAGVTSVSARRIECLRLLKGTPETRPFSFIVVTAWDPLVVYGRLTFLSHLLEAQGGRNMVESAILFPQLSREWLWLHKPDRIYSVDMFQKRDDSIALDVDLYSRISFALIRDLKRLGFRLPETCRE